MNKKLNFILFTLIIFLTFFLRFYQLGKVPQTLNRDELADGYNAYSLLLTGKDEYGVKWPLWLLSIGDYKPPVYIYLTALAIKFFGFSEFSFRFISALAGSLTVLVTFFLVKELLNGFSDEFKITTSLFASFLLAICPWHFFYSRQVFESILALFFSLTGVFFLLKARRKKFFFILSSIFFILAIFTYNPPLFIVPILIPVIIIFFLSDYLKKGKLFLICFITIFYLSLLGYYLSSRNLIKGRSEATILQPLYLETQLSNIKNRQNNFLIKLISRKKIYIIYKFFYNYLSNFKPDFLFFGGDGHLWHGLRFYGTRVGNLFLITLPLFIFGIFFILKSRRKELLLIIIWLLISPIACSLTQDAPNTNRLNEFLFLILLISAIGFTYILEVLKKKSIHLTLLILLIFLILSFNYLQFYFTQFNQNLCDSKFKSMNLCGIKEIANFIKTNKNYEKFIFLINDGNEEIYLQMAFYLKFNPADFQKYAWRRKSGFIYVIKYKNFHFLVYNDDKSLTELKRLSKNEKNLYVFRENPQFAYLTKSKARIIKKELFIIKDRQGKILWFVGE